MLARLDARSTASTHAGFLGKPFTRDSLLRKLREMLDAPVA